ncbi:PF11950 family protein [Bacteroidetes bacterium oral taxon 272 str. F0290]|nr:PF11950 family protein [Bacteroidetes bacterium oral taxon 272 str. F0290]
MMENGRNDDNAQLQIELKDEVAQGTYANLAIIAHSSSEFIVDFVRVMPGLPKAGVQSRIILTPEHAKRLLFALQENIAKYERALGPIRMPENIQGGSNSPDGKTFIPPLNGFKGEA